MSGLNKVMVIGNIGMDPELKYTQSGQAILRMRMAVNESWKDRDGQKQERTEWATVIMWGKRAEGLAPHLGKGDRVYIEGRMQTRDWEDKDGNRRTTTEIVAHELLFLGGKRGDGQRSAQSQQRSAPADDFPADDGGAFGDDDIPFRRVDGRLS